MVTTSSVCRSIALFVLLSAMGGSLATAQTTTYEPTPGQAGKDVVWVPTPQELVDKMLDMAKVTPQDIVMDLGSGDGRNVIAAAKRGARAYGFEFNPEMVALSRRRAQEAGVADRATASSKATCSRLTSQRRLCWRCSCCRAISTSSRPSFFPCVRGRASSTTRSR